ncbi:ATP-dependent DNA helicase [Aphis craccivora]|uniref:ATP-dependent DNA helicase n=1 Tax=Aphis craccivora TaxID=307492 RepID=A0A6G0VZH5_APHCR|nr:ATP-dependent DNA helicase [Aphis craccivora]
MTINKAQGQSLEVCGLNFENSCFSHGQLACSCVRKSSDLFLYTTEGITKKKKYCVSKCTSINIIQSNMCLNS